MLHEAHHDVRLWLADDAADYSGYRLGAHSDVAFYEAVGRDTLPHFQVEGAREALAA